MSIFTVGIRAGLVAGLGGLIGLFAIGACAAAANACAPLEVKAGTTIKANQKALLDKLHEDACTAAALKAGIGGNPSLLDVLKLAFADTVAPRGDRLKTPPPSGMPSGLVLPVDGQVVFDATAVKSERIVAFDIKGPTRGGGARAIPDGGVLALPGASFQPGVDYRWTLATGKNAYDATFSVAPRDVTERVEARVRAASAAEPEETARLALIAAIYDDEELFTDRDRVIAQLRSRLGP